MNERIMGLRGVTGYPVEQDEYEGGGDRYIVFSYEDERGAFWVDDEEQATAVNLQVSLFVPKGHDYFADKRKIKEYLRGQGFQVGSIQTWLEKDGAKRIRRVTFSVSATEME